MQIKPSADVLQALSSLPADRVAARPKLAPPQAPRSKLAAAQAPRAVAGQAAPKPPGANPGRSYRPGTFLDIYV